MTFLRALVEFNQETILFASGLVFFVLGLAITLQSRHTSRLEFARSLSWLSAFGFAHGLHEWGDLFIPIQAAYLPDSAVQSLYSLQLLLLAVSYTCLFTFGVALLRSLDRRGWLQGTPIALFLVWVLLVLVISAGLSGDVGLWRNTGDALARYLIGFPGGLIAAYGLRRHVRRRILPLNVPHIVRTLRVAGVAMALYAFFGGLIPLPVPFFPGDVLNFDSFEAVLGVPPAVPRSLIGLAMAIAIIRAMEIFDVEIERMIEAMEQGQILTAERMRIARELHDGSIQKVYTAGLLVEAAHNLVEADTPADERLQRAINALNDALSDLRRNLGELRAAPTDLPLVEALRRLAEDERYRSLVEISLDLNLPESDNLTPARANHVLAIVQEALANVLRHARASQVKITADGANGQLVVTVEDDGIGLPSEIEPGFGLRNMRERALLLGGQLHLEGVGGKGTVVRLDVPWEEEER